MTICNGQIRVQNHQLVGVDIEEMIREYTGKTEELIVRREPYIPTQEEASINNVVV